MAGQLISGCLQQLQVIAGPVGSGVLENLGSTAFEAAGEQVKLIKDVEKQFEKLRSNLTAIQAVLSDAEKRQIDDVSVRNWLDKLKDVSCDIVDVLNEWITAVNRSRSARDEDQEEEGGGGESNIARPAKKVRLSHLSKLSSWFSSTFPVREVGLRRSIACKINELNERLDVIAVEKSRYSFNTARVVEKRSTRRKTTSFVDVSKVYGRDKEKEVLMTKLLSNNNSKDIVRGFNIISIVGPEGIGKTTLAQLVYNDNEIKNHFKKRIWLGVSDPFDEIRIAKAIMEALEGRAVELVEMESLLQQIHASIEGKRFLLVLDDVCTEDPTKWEALKEVLKNGAEGSRILVTTQKEEVVVMMGEEADKICLEPLPEDVAASRVSRFQGQRS